MGQSEVLKTRHQGNWYEGVLQTDDSDKNDNKTELYSEAIERYVNEIQSLEFIGTKGENNSIDEIPILNLPNYSDKFDIFNSKKYSKKIQNWKGVITSTSEKSFTARLYDLTSGGTDEYGEFDIEDISPDDMVLLASGAIFYWSVGHYMENGQSVKRSDIRFQRLITLDEEDINTANDNVSNNYGNLKEKYIDNDFS